MARDIEKEFDALLKAKMEQLPAWHENIAQPGNPEISVEEGLDLLYGMIRVHRDMLAWLAREVNDLARSQDPDP